MREYACMPSDTEICIYWGWMWTPEDFSPACPADTSFPLSFDLPRSRLGCKVETVIDSKTGQKVDFAERGRKENVYK